MLVALGTLFVVPLFVSSPSGTSVETSGAVIDLIAIAVLVLAAWSLWRDRSALF
jgi:hypothetical protein